MFNIWVINAVTAFWFCIGNVALGHLTTLASSIGTYTSGELYFINIVRGLNAGRACKVGAMTKGNIPDADRKNKYCICCCLDMLKTC